MRKYILKIQLLLSFFIISCGTNRLNISSNLKDRINKFYKPDFKNSQKYFEKIENITDYEFYNAIF